MRPSKRTLASYGIRSLAENTIRALLRLVFSWSIMSLCIRFGSFLLIILPAMLRPMGDGARPEAGSRDGRGIGGVAHDEGRAGERGTLHKNCVPRVVCTLHGTSSLAPDKQGRGGLLLMLFDAQCITLHQWRLYVRGHPNNCSCSSGSACGI